MSSLRNRAAVAGNVIGAGKNDNHFRLQIDHILTEADQHLRSGLPADPAIDVRLTGKMIPRASICR